MKTLSKDNQLIVEQFINHLRENDIPRYGDSEGYSGNDFKQAGEVLENTDNIQESIQYMNKFIEAAIQFSTIIGGELNSQALNNAWLTIVNKIRGDI